MLGYLIRLFEISLSLTRSSLHIARARLGLVLLGQIVEAYPALSILNIIELLKDLLLIVPRRLHHSPERDEFFQADFSIIVCVDLGEELIGRNATERAFPVLERLSFVDSIATIDVENAENFVHSLQARLRELLKILYGVINVRQKLSNKILT